MTLTELLFLSVPLTLLFLSVFFIWKNIDTSLMTGVQRTESSLWFVWPAPSCNEKFRSTCSTIMASAAQLRGPSTACQSLTQTRRLSQWVLHCQLDLCDLRTVIKSCFSTPLLHCVPLSVSLIAWQKSHVQMLCLSHAHKSSRTYRTDGRLRIIADDKWTFTVLSLSCSSGIESYCVDWLNCVCYYLIGFCSLICQSYSKSVCVLQFCICREVFCFPKMTRA